MEAAQLPAEASLPDSSAVLDKTAACITEPLVVDAMQPAVFEVDGGASLPDSSATEDLSAPARWPRPRQRTLAQGELVNKLLDELAAPAAPEPPEPSAGAGEAAFAPLTPANGVEPFERSQVFKDCGPLAGYGWLSMSRMGGFMPARVRPAIQRPGVCRSHVLVGALGPIA
ncbi:hypothetical protein WJX81_007352 [Elliptochloris bilobata]|uniref:Uncharacterized protein n=1 Tax=Elliptochloris bilobata TaxID=381761 RepID=A0AAW1S0G1_9CHLO